MSSGGLYAAAVAALPAIGPARLAALLDRWPPEEAWARVAAGRAGAPPDVAKAWQDHARRADLAADAAAREAAGIAVHVRGQPGYPVALAADHEAPAVLFSRG